MTISHALGEKLLTRKKRRIWEIDFLRGICIVLMIFDHMMFDFSCLSSLAYNFYTVKNTFFVEMEALAYYYWWDWPVRQAVRYTVIFLFLFLSGISCSLTRSNVGRLRKLSIGAALITLITVSIDFFAGMFFISIVFGILHILVLSLLIYMTIKAVLPNPYVYLFIGAALTAAGFFLPAGNGQTITFWQVENTLAVLNWDSFFKILAGTHLYGSDSYGIFPYTGFFLLGAATGAIAYSKKRSLMPAMDGSWNKAYSFIGRHGIIIYLAHQVAIFALVMFSAMAVGYRFF